MEETFYDIVFGYSSEFSKDAFKKEDEEVREFLLTKGIELSEDDMENEIPYVSLLLMLDVWYGGYNTIDFLKEDFIKGIHIFHRQADKKDYAVTLELKNGYDLSFDALEGKRYILRVYIHDGCDVSDAPAIRKILDEDYYTPDRISELPNDAHLQSWFEVYLKSDYDAGLEVYGLDTYEQVKEKMLEERDFLKKKYSS